MRKDIFSFTNRHDAHIRVSRQFEWIWFKMISPSSLSIYYIQSVIEQPRSFQTAWLDKTQRVGNAKKVFFVLQTIKALHRKHIAYKLYFSCGSAIYGSIRNVLIVCIYVCCLFINDILHIQKHLVFRHGSIRWIEHRGTNLSFLNLCACLQRVEQSRISMCFCMCNISLVNKQHI